MVGEYIQINISVSCKATHWYNHITKIRCKARTIKLISLNTHWLNQLKKSYFTYIARKDCLCCRRCDRVYVLPIIFTLKSMVKMWNSEAEDSQRVLTCTFSSKYLLMEVIGVSLFCFTVPSISLIPLFFLLHCHRFHGHSKGHFLGFIVFKTSFISYHIN